MQIELNEEMGRGLQGNGSQDLALLLPLHQQQGYFAGELGFSNPLYLCSLVPSA
jgi:hypothetical protein